MSWSCKLSKPITLDDGRVLITLRDAADLTLALNDRQKADIAWQYAIRLMMRASEAEATEDDLTEARRQLYTVLWADGLIGIRRSRERR